MQRTLGTLSPSHVPLPLDVVPTTASSLPRLLWRQDFLDLSNPVWIEAGCGPHAIDSTVRPALHCAAARALPDSSAWKGLEIEFMAISHTTAIESLAGCHSLRQITTTAVLQARSSLPSFEADKP